MKLKRGISLILPILVAIILLLFPAPEGLSPHAWRFFAIFVGVIIGLILEPFPGAVIGIAAIVVIAIFSPWVLFSPEQMNASGFQVANQSF